MSSKPGSVRGVERGWRDITEARECGGGGGVERGWRNIPEAREC